MGLNTLAVIVLETSTALIHGNDGAELADRTFPAGCPGRRAVYVSDALADPSRVLTMVVEELLQRGPIWHRDRGWAACEDHSRLLRRSQCSPTCHHARHDSRWYVALSECF